MGLALLVAVSSSCAIPTDLPRAQSRWIVPTEETSFGVEQLLPGAVTVSSDSSAFLVDFDPAAFSQTLGGLCPPCVAADGLTVPKPPFTGAVTSQIDFPPEVFAVVVLDGQVDLEIFNGLGFDPIRPAAGAFGSMTLRITDDADDDVLSELVIDGANTPFGPGSTLTRRLTLAPTDVNGSLVATVLLDSPLGDPVTIDASAELSVVATPTTIRVAAVDIDVGNRSVSFDPVDLGVEDVDEGLEDAVVEGAILLDVVNPFGLTAVFDISLTAPGVTTIQRSSAIGAEPMSTVRIDFTGDEIRSFLGEPDVVLSGNAVVDATVGIVRVSPGEELVLSANLDLTVEFGGGGS